MAGDDSQEVGQGPTPRPAPKNISFENLDPTDFEEFCHDLLIELGFLNVDWRKGTPKKASPSDRGRDLVAQRELTDVDGHTRLETWFVDCKHYKTGVSLEPLQGLLAWAEAERPDVALVIASGYLSNAAKDGLADYERTRRPPFRIRYWERPTLARMLGDHPELLDTHEIFIQGMRTVSQILEAEQEFFDKVWYVRKLILEEAIEDGRHEPLQPDIERMMHEAMRRVEEKRGRENLGPWDDWHWGYVHGHLSALRWVLGDDWDFLDT
jgi:Restriction endonuclease